MRILLLLSAALALSACNNNCTPGPRDEPSRCAPLADAGSPDCVAATPTCAAIIGTADAGADYRCFGPCASGACDKSGYSCEPTAIGNCGAQFGGDGGACETRFLCMPNYCGG